MTVLAVDSATWVTALAGLLGVLVGGLIQVVREVAIARRQERGETVAAARLVNAEIVRTGLILALTRKEREWAFLAAVDGVYDRAWESQKGALARHLDDDAWRRVMWAYSQVETLLILYGSEGRAETLNDDDVGTIDAALWHLREANELLLVPSRKLRSERADAKRTPGTPAWARTARPPAPADRSE